MPSIDDLERAYLATQLGLTVAEVSGRSQNDLMTAVYPGGYRSHLCGLLGITLAQASGRPDSDLIRAYLNSEGYVGSLADQLIAFYTTPPAPAVDTLVPSMLASGSNNTPADVETLVAGGTVTPASNSLLLCHVAYATSGGVFADTPTSLTGFGLTWTPIAFAKPFGGSTRSVACYVAQGAAPSSAALVLTTSYTPDDTTFELFQVVGAAVGNGGLDAILQVVVIPTTANGTSVQGWIQDVQHANNAVFGLFSVGVNSQSINQAAGETGWTRVGNIAGAAGTAFSMAGLFRAGSADLSPKAGWASSGSPQYIGLEIKANGATTRFPMDYNNLRAGQGESSANTAVHTTGRSVHTDIVTTLDSDIITSGTANFDASFVGASITGTNIPGGTTILAVNANARAATMSAVATGTGTVTGTVTGRKTPFVSGRSYIMGIMGVRNTAAGTPTTVALTGGGSFTLIDSILYDTLAIPSGSDTSLSLWKYTASATVEDTVIITFPAATTHGAAWGIIELENNDAAVNAANIAKNSTTVASTSFPLTMGAYAQADNGVVGIWGRAGGSTIDPIPSEGMVIAIDQSDASNRVLTMTYAHSNIATPDLTFGSSVVGAIAVELSAA